MGKSVDGDKIYDDEIVRNISKELSDRLTSLYLIGDAIRAIRKPIKLKEITADEFEKRALDLITLGNDIFRDDIMQLTKIVPVFGNGMIPFMNGGP
jgi:hypothetical protein